LAAAVAPANLGRDRHTCPICAACGLCQECYDKRQEINAGDTAASWTSFCGQDHEYLKGPIEGWKGVKDGMIRISGEEPVAFKKRVAWFEGGKIEGRMMPGLERRLK
jgi:hypothetical protein